MIQEIKENSNKRCKSRNKQSALDVIMFENIRELSRYISGMVKALEFKIPDIAISRNDTMDMRNKILSIYALR